MGQRNIWNPIYKDTLFGILSFETKSKIGRMLFNKTAPSDGEFLNLGCGDSYYKNFVNSDFFNGFKFWKKRKRKVDWQLDLRYPLNCPNNRWNGVFSEHVLEHLYHDEVIFLLKEIERTMMPGATLRIVVPDLQQCCEDYCSNNVTLSGETGARVMWSLTQNWAHKSLWDFELMFEALELAGFIKIHKCQFLEGELPELLKDSPHRRHRSLYVEAKKRIS